MAETSRVVGGQLRPLNFLIFFVVLGENLNFIIGVLVYGLCLSSTFFFFLPKKKTIFFVSSLPLINFFFHLLKE